MGMLRLLLLFLLLCQLSQSQQNNNNPQRRRPNILFLLTDQQRFDTLRRVQEELPFYANATKIRTPNLDRLSRQGAYFRNAYCQSSVCAPARTSLRTGCTIERTGVQHNDMYKQDVWADPKNQLFAERITALRGIDQVLVDHYGYVSEHYGKWHMPSTLYNRQSTSNSQRAVRFNDFDYSNKRFYFRDVPNAERIRKYLKHFQQGGDINKQLKVGQQIDTYTRYPYTPNRMDARFGHPKNSALSKASGFSRLELSQANVVGTYGLPEQYTPSHFTGDVALRALKRLVKQDNDKPWFLTVSFHSPHPPMVAARKHLQYYWDHKDHLFVPPNIHDDMDNADYDQISRYLPKYGDPKFVQEWTATYYALIEEIDDHIGQLLDALEASPAVKNNTIILFTSDHGEMLGAHGKREKNTFYEEASHVPLLLAYDQAIEPGVEIDQLVSHIDVFSTLLDYVGASPEDIDSSDGSSLRPVLEKQSFNEYYDENVVVAEWDFRKAVNNNKLTRTIDERPSLLVRKGGWKLLTHRLAASHKLDMMFHLESDPYELNNVLGKNAATASPSTLMKAEHLRCLLLEWMERMDGEEGLYSDPANNYGEGKGDIRELWDRQSWPALDFWVSDMDELRFSRGAWLEGRYIRNEYLYFGTRTSGHLPTVRIEVVGPDTSNLKLETSSVFLQQNQCHRVKVTLECRLTDCPSFDSMQASIDVRMNGHPDINIPIVIDHPDSPGREFVTQYSPSSRSSCTPSGSPSGNPTDFPPESPLSNLTQFPTTFPSEAPSGQPSISHQPSFSPSQSPSNAPSISHQPSNSPSQNPSNAPSTSHQPSFSPSNNPSDTPSTSHTPTFIPTQSPSDAPSMSYLPSSSPTQNPSESTSPTQRPSNTPSSAPTREIRRVGLWFWFGRWFNR